MNGVGSRLERAGADPDNLHLPSDALTKGIFDSKPRTRGLTFPDDIQYLAYALARLENPSLVIIDSLSEFCPDATRERQTMRLLHRLASEYVVAIVVVSRGAGGRDEQGRFQAANDRAFAAARCVWSVAEDPEDPALYRFLPVHLSYGPRPGGMAFRIVGGQVAWEEARSPARRPLTPAVEEVMHWLEPLL